MEYNTFRGVFSRKSAVADDNGARNGCIVTWWNADGKHMNLVKRYKTYTRRSKRYVAFYGAQLRPLAIVPISSILEVE